MDLLQRARRHRLGAVGDQLQRRQVVALLFLGQQQQVEERRRGRQQLDAMGRDRLADLARRAPFRHHHGAGVRQRVEERVHAADVIELQEDERPVAVARDAELLEQRAQVVHRRLVLPGRTGREEHQPGAARPVAQRGVGCAVATTVSPGGDDRRPARRDLRRLRSGRRRYSTSAISRKSSRCACDAAEIGTSTLPALVAARNTATASAPYSASMLTTRPAMPRSASSRCQSATRASSSR